MAKKSSMWGDLGKVAENIGLSPLHVLQDLPGGIGQTFQNLPSAIAHPMSQWPFSGGGGGGGGKKPDPKVTPGPTPSSTQVTVNPPDALTAGLQMYVNQYMLPQLAQVASQNQQLMGQYQAGAQQALQNPYLTPQQKAYFTAANRTNMAGMQQLDAASQAQALYGGQYTDWMNLVGQNVQALQAAVAEAQKASAYEIYGLGGLPYGSQSLANIPGLDPITKALLQQASSVANPPAQTKGGKTSATSTQPAPIIVNTGAQGQTGTQAQPSTTTTPGATSADIAQAIANALLNQQQGTAASANAIAGAGYTPPTYTPPTP